jgi:F0F1-type ATP synthase assembly protein I
MTSHEELTKKIDKHTSVKTQKRNEKKALALPLEIFAGVLVGSFIGYHCDRYFGTAPVFLIICLFFGAAGSFLNIYRSILKEER